MLPIQQKGFIPDIILIVATMFLDSLDPIVWHGKVFMLVKIQLVRDKSIISGA